MKKLSLLPIIILGLSGCQTAPTTSVLDDKLPVEFVNIGAKTKTPMLTLAYKNLNAHQRYQNKTVTIAPTSLPLSVDVNLCPEVSDIGISCDSKITLVKSINDSYILDVDMNYLTNVDKQSDIYLPSMTHIGYSSTLKKGDLLQGIDVVKTPLSSFSYIFE